MLGPEKYPLIRLTIFEYIHWKVSTKQDLPTFHGFMEHPTKPFTISEPHSLSIGNLYVVKKCELWKGRSGSSFSSELYK